MIINELILDMFKYIKSIFRFPIDLYIDYICWKYGIGHYLINNDGSIDVIGDVKLSNRHLKKIPLKFNKVSGNFNCSNNLLKSLKNCPKEVSGSFDIEYNSLSSLDGCTDNIGGSIFVIEGNPLHSLLKSKSTYIREILRYQDDYSIWNKDKTLNVYRFNDMMEEIEESHNCDLD